MTKLLDFLFRRNDVAPARPTKGWMGTASGRRFFPFDPHHTDVDISDIARGLSNCCRYSGQVKTFYSVAEHCYLVSKAIDPKYARFALLHDSAEAYIGDLIRPIKHQPQMAEFRRAEALIEVAVYKHFGLVWTDEAHAAVKEVDDRILVDEIKMLSAIPSYYLSDPPLSELQPLNIGINCWAPIVAEYMFLKRFEELFA